jgi:hypothetical protein
MSAILQNKLYSEKAASHSCTLYACTNFLEKCANNIQHLLIDYSRMKFRKKSSAIEFFIHIHVFVQSMISKILFHNKNTFNANPI